jgi:hypothetical protein
MTLRTETTVEYFFDKPYMFFCKHHDTLGISDNHEDSVQINGVSQDNINTFIEHYFEYVLEDAPMKEYFLERVSKVKEAVEDE